MLPRSAPQENRPAAPTAGAPGPGEPPPRRRPPVPAAAAATPFPGPAQVPEGTAPDPPVGSRPRPGTEPEPPPGADLPRGPVTPVGRLLSLAVAGFALMLAVGLIFGAQTAGLGWLRLSYAVVIFGIQVLFVLALTMALRPPGPAVVALAGLLAAAAADLAAVVPGEAALAPLGYVAAAGAGVALAGQLATREGRIRFTESLTASAGAAGGVAAYAALVVLTRLPGGTQAITAALAAAGLAVTVARLADAVVPWPRLSPHVSRGAPGVVLGPMAGTGMAAFLGGYLVGFDPTDAALLGLATSVAAVLADLSVGYADAGRRLVGAPPTMWIARHLYGPLTGFAVAAVLTYLLSVAFVVPRF